MSVLELFGDKTRAWFEGAFAEPTPAQALGWPAIAKGGNVLIQAPTGSGKTLAAFLYGIDRLDASPGAGLRLLYVSPLKALNYDVERNLRGPLAGPALGPPGGRAHRATRRRRSASRWRASRRTSSSRRPSRSSSSSRHRPGEMLRTVETLILDEVHAVAGTKRGAHLALTVERLDRLVQKPVQRIGLSATQRPLEEIGRFVSGGRPIELVDAGRAKELDLEVVVPVEDMRELPSNATLSYPAPADGQEMDAGTELGARSIWPSIYPEILRLVEQHRSTIVFVNNRRLAERLALRLNELAERELARAHHGSLAREQRVEVEELLEEGRDPVPRGHVVARAGHRHGRGRPRDPGGVAEVRRARGLQRVGRAGHELGAVSKGRIFPKFRADLLESAVVSRRMRDGAIEETVIPRNPLDVLAQHVVAICAEEEVAVDDLHELVRGAYPFSDLSRCSWRTSSTCSRAATRPTSSPSCGPASRGIARAGRSAASPGPAGWR